MTCDTGTYRLQWNSCRWVQLYTGSPLTTNTTASPEADLSRLINCSSSACTSGESSSSSSHVPTASWSSAHFLISTATPRAWRGENRSVPFGTNGKKGRRRDAGAAGGTDNVTNDMLHQLSSSAERQLLEVLNWSWRTGEGPASWRAQRSSRSQGRENRPPRPAATGPSACRAASVSSPSASSSTDSSSGSRAPES